MRKTMSTLGVLLFAAFAFGQIFTPVAFGQSQLPVTNVTTEQLSFPIYTLNPQPISQANVTTVGVQGSTTYYYWIVAHYSIGTLAPSGPFTITTAPGTLSVSNYDQISFTYPLGITNVDVLRSTGLSPPVGVCNCAVATAVASGNINDQSNTLNAYTVPAAVVPLNYVLNLQNEVQGSGVTHLILRQGPANTFIADLSNASSGSLPGGCSNGQTAEWNGTTWVCATAGLGTITGVTTNAGSGLSGGGSSGSLTLSLLSTCASSQVLEWNGSAWACATPGTVSSVATGTGLTGGPITSTGTISLATPVSAANGGTGAASLAGFIFGNGASAATAATAGQAATLIQGLTGCNTSGYVFTPQASDCVAGGGSGTVTSITAAGGLTGGVITTSGTVTWPFTAATYPGYPIFQRYATGGTPAFGPSIADVYVAQDPNVVNGNYAGCAAINYVATNDEVTPGTSIVSDATGSQECNVFPIPAAFPNQLNVTGASLYYTYGNGVDWVLPRGMHLVGTGGNGQTETGTKGFTIRACNTAIDSAGVCPTSFPGTALVAMSSTIPSLITLTQATYSAGSVTYTYSAPVASSGSNGFAGQSVAIGGFTNAGNNGTFVVTSSTTTTLVAVNAGGVNESHTASAGGLPAFDVEARDFQVNGGYLSGVTDMMDYYCQENCRGNYLDLVGWANGGIGLDVEYKGGNSSFRGLNVVNNASTGATGSTSAVGIMLANGCPKSIDDVTVTNAIITPGTEGNYDVSAGCTNGFFDGFHVETYGIAGIDISGSSQSWVNVNSSTVTDTTNVTSVVQIETSARAISLNNIAANSPNAPLNVINDLNNNAIPAAYTQKVSQYIIDSNAHVVADTSGLNAVNFFGGILPGSVKTTQLSTPSAPTVTPEGTTGGASYSYKIVANDNVSGTTPASGAGSTTTGNATLSSGNYNLITFNPVHGASGGYSVYRTVGGGTQGLIGTVGPSGCTSGCVAIATNTAYQFSDTGLSATGSAPSTNTTGSADFLGSVNFPGGAIVPSGATLTIASGGTLTCAAGSTCPGGGSMTWPSAAGIAVYSGSSSWSTSIPSAISSPLLGQTITVNSTPALVNAYPGVTVDARSSASPTITGDGTGSDRLAMVQTTNSTTSTAVTVPQAGSTGFASSFAFLHCNTGSVVATDTPGTSTINGNTTAVLVGKVSTHNPECMSWFSDGSNYWGAEALPTDANGRLGAEGFGALTGAVTNSAGSYATTVNPTLTFGTQNTTAGGPTIAGSSSAGGAITINGDGASPGSSVLSVNTAGTTLYLGNSTSGASVTSAGVLSLPATTNQIVTGAGSNLTTLTFPASSGAVTLSFPNTTDTMVGRATSDTLTNKSIAGSEINSSLVGAAYGGTGVNNTVTLTLGTTARNYATLGTGFEYNTTTTGAATDATAAQLGALIDVAQYDLLVSGGTAAAVAGIAFGAGTTLQGSATNPTATATPTFGVQATTAGSLTLAGTSGTSGTVTFNGGTSGSAAITASATGVLALPSGTTVTNLSATTPNIGAATYTSLTSSTKCSAASSSGTVSCSAAPAGLFSCDTSTSASTCLIDTSAVTATSVIQIQPDASAGITGGCNATADSGLTTPRIASRVAGTSFTINMGTFITTPECFSYVIIN